MTQPQANYSLNVHGQTTIVNYQQAKAFSSFLPGIAGVMGIPMWVFYVNRGQGIAGFGIDTKDQAILEFQSANRAYQLTPTVGYRTFVKVDGALFEPFSKTASAQVSQTMTVSSHALDIEEHNGERGLTTKVSYFTVPDEAVAALGRMVTLTNTSTNTVALELLDGLPQVVNYGLNHGLLKNLSYLTEAWALVENIEQRAPLYKIKIAVNDSPEVEFVHSGNFYLARASGAQQLAPVIVDPALVFGLDESLQQPLGFAQDSAFAIPAMQCNQKLTPCAFSHFCVTLRPGESFSFFSYAGNARNADFLNAFAAKVLADADYGSRAAARNEQVVAQIQDDVLTVSGNRRFDAYTRQNYLDNVLRGGRPCELGDSANRALFYLYSRKHGDMERDYNHYKIAPTYFSQGNGNYRDVNQNRRNDVLINPFVGDSAIRTFLNLIQLDGNNPLVVFGARFICDDGDRLDRWLAETVAAPSATLRALLHSGFTPGDLLRLVEDEGLRLLVDPETFVAQAVSRSERFEDAEHGEGFWTDHWTYNTDLIESYLALYPEREPALFFGEPSFTFFDTYCRVAPRSDKYQLTEHGVRQYGAVVEDKQRHALLAARERNPNAVRTGYGDGQVFRTNLFCKLLVLVLNKAANLDPSGVGIEMESNKPNWYDALNSLPALLGSSICETYELKRLLQLMRLAAARRPTQAGDGVSVPVEVAQFMQQLCAAFALPAGLDQWEARCNAKEAYRARTFTGIDGALAQVPFADFERFAELVLAAIRAGSELALDPHSGLPSTYFAHDVTAYELTGREAGGVPLVRPTSFERRALPLFLEGVVHAMRCEPDAAKVRSLHQATLRSGLYDQKLRMFKVNASLEGEGFDIGRSRAFPAGWLENESVWLHMEYKYLLELARKGLFAEFFDAADSALVFNLDPQVYGRSILENSSFICSSAYYDASKHGQGFYARLSGSTAEFIHMWLLMVIGAAPFKVDASGALTLTFAPAIPGRYFTNEARSASMIDPEGRSRALEVPANGFAFKLLGATPVVYLNPERLDTYCARVVQVSLFDADGALLHRRDGAGVSGEWAERVRERRIGRIEALVGPKSS